MKFGYARVSTPSQNLNLQIDALVQHGCDQIFQEHISATKKNRPELDKLLAFVRKGDVIVIWKLDRLGRSVMDLIKIINQLREKEVELVSLQDHLDTTTPSGKLIFHMMAALAEFERDMISERTKAGLKAARARGRKGGRPPGMSKRLKGISPAVKAVYDSEQLTNKEICKQFNISVGTIYRCIAYAKSLEEKAKNQDEFLHDKAEEVYNEYLEENNFNH